MRNLGKSFDTPGVRIRSIPGQGRFFERIYQGTPNAIIQVAGQLDSGTFEFDQDQETPRHQILVRQPVETKDGPGGVALEIRETINRVHKSIFEPPGPASVTEDELRTIREAIQNPQPGVGPALTNPDAIELYLLALKGVEYRPVYQPVLSVVRTATTKFNWPASRYANVGRIHSDQDMIDDAGIGSLLNFSLGSVAFAAEVAPDGFGYGWLKHMPWYDLAVGNRSAEYLEYEFGLWSTFLHPEAG